MIMECVKGFGINGDVMPKPCLFTVWNLKMISFP